MSDYDDDFMAEDEDYDLEYSEDSNRCEMCFWKKFSIWLFVPCSEPDVDLENQYYNSKSLKEKDPKAALESFQRVLDLENGEKGMFNIMSLRQTIFYNWYQVNGGSKRWNRWSRSTSGWAISEKWWQGMIACLQHMYLIQFNNDNVDNLYVKELRTTPLILFELRYKQLLTYIKSAVTRNHSEKSINSILDYISTSKQVKPIFC